MSNSKDIKIDDFDYSLPEESIAKFPLENRDATKLLVYGNKRIESRLFSEISTILPPKSLLVFNKTKVIQARLFFEKESGASIEIFCLEPTNYNSLLLNTNTHETWKCLVGNNKKWKEGFLTKRKTHQGKELILTADRKEAVENAWIVEFSWNDASLRFVDVLEIFGEIPLPPYLKRQVEDSDKHRYQTIYAEIQGSVAAPTAGLHFTEKTFAALQQNNIDTDFVTLHVGAGTFKPVTTNTIGEHIMHTEHIEVSKKTLVHLLANLENPIVAVGTTSARTLESLFWHGAKILSKECANPLAIDVLQWDAYQERYNKFSTKEALEVIISELENQHQEYISGQTQMMITPGYTYRVIKGLLTNFHQPKSTLLLLVSALIGDSWKKVYEYALQNNFRFLSYGDCCLFWDEK